MPASSRPPPARSAPAPSMPEAAPPPAGLRYRAPARLIGGQFQIESNAPVAILASVSLVLCILIFPPVNWWLLAYVCLTPWLVFVCTSDRPKRVYVASYALGVGFFLINVHWMAPVTLPGYVALAVFFGLSFPIAAWPLRHMFRRHGASMAIALPIVWTAVEFIRSQTLIGFPWFLLAHSQYRVIPIIQISDLIGAYGVSFVIAMVNGWITDLLIQPILIWRREQPERTTRLPIGSFAVVAVVTGTLVYGGMTRLPTTDESATTGPASGEVGGTNGPRIVVLQHDFPMFVDLARLNQTPPTDIYHAYMELVKQVVPLRPDLIVLPETAWPGYMNKEFLEADASYLEALRAKEFPRSTIADVTGYRDWCRQTLETLRAAGREAGATIVTGAASIEWKPTEIPPRVERYNSAFRIPPDPADPILRYDKVHVVLFGEFVPFRYGRFHALYEWLNSITPWGAGGLEYSLTAGDEFVPFEFAAQSLGGKRFRAGAPICYEDTVPYVARSFAEPHGRSADRGEEKKRVDVLLNISNDGWFMHSSQLEQHLASSVFRAVEHRVSVARAVNTGASAIIDPDGTIRRRVTLRPQQREALKQVEESVRRLLAIAEAPRKHTTRQLLHDELMMLRKAVESAGPEFSVLTRRISRQIDRLDMARPAVVGAADPAEDLPESLRAEMETVQRWRERPDTAPGFAIDSVHIDPRSTIYTRWGDWFATGCALVMVAMWLDWFMHRLRDRARRPAGRATVAAAMLGPPLLLLSGGCSQWTYREPTLAETQQLERRAFFALVSAAGDEQPLHRMHAIEALQHVAPSEGILQIRAGLRDPQPAVRFAALMALGTLRDMESVEPIRMLAEDPDANVRVAAIYAMHRLGDFSRTSELASLLLNNPQAGVRANAALAIGMLSEKKSMKLLTRAKRDKDESVRLQVLEAMVMLGDEKSTRDLLFYGHSGVGQKMVEALMTLGTVRAAMARELFGYRFNEGPYEEVRLAAARGLGRLGDPRGFEFAVEQLAFRSSHRDDDIDPPEQHEARVRTLAAAALEAIGDRRALRPLQHLLDDARQPLAVRLAAARAICAIARGDRESPDFEPAAAARS